MLKRYPFSNSVSQSLRRATRVALLATACLSFSALGQAAEAPVAPLGVTTGGGYVPMVKALNEVCKSPHLAIEGHFGGNIGQQLAQIEAGSGVSVVISDAATLKRLKTNVTFDRTLVLGQSPLVLVWRSGLALNSPADLKTEKVKTIAAPDPKAAVYGRVAKEWREHLSAAEQKALEAKWLQVGHVPQVISYVVRGEADAGFVNVVSMKKNAEKLGGHAFITSGYEPITMTAQIVKGAPNAKAAEAYLDCLATPKAQSVLAKFGVSREKK